MYFESAPEKEGMLRKVQTSQQSPVLPIYRDIAEP